MDLKATITCWWVCCIPLFVVAQISPHPFFRNYSTEDGLPSNTNYCLFEDSEGFIWAGNEYGASRYDGERWHRLPTTTDLNFLQVFHLDQDSAGRIWMNTLSGRLFFVEDDSIHAYSKNHLILSIRPRSLYADALVCSGDTVYNFLYNFGIVRATASGHFSTLRNESNVQKYLVMEKADRVVLTKTSPVNESNAYWRQELKQRQKQGIREDLQWLDQSNRVWSNFTFTKQRNNSRSTMLSLDENAYLLYLKGTLYYLENDTVIWQQEFPHEITYMFRDRSDAIYLCCLMGGGVLRSEGVQCLEEGVFQALLPGQDVSYGIQDSQGGFWFSTLHKGVFYAADISLQIYDTSTGLPEEDVLFVSRTGDHSVTYVDVEYGLYTLDRRTGLRTVQRSFAEKFPRIFDIHQDTSCNALWLAGGHLWRLQGGDWEELGGYGNPKTSLLGIKSMESLEVGDTLLVWGTEGFGLFDSQTGRMILNSKTQGIAGRMDCVFLDRTGRIWLSTKGQGFEYNAGQLQSLQNQHPHFAYPLLAITKLPDGTLVFCPNSKGLLLWKPDGEFYTIREKDGLTFDQIRQVQVDRDGILWASSIHGLNRIQFSASGDWSITTFTTKNGLPSNVINDMDVSGRSPWVATDRGLVLLQDEHKMRTPEAPLINKVLVNKEPVDIENPKLAYWQNNLQLVCAFLDYQQYGDVHYRYALDDGTWNQTRNSEITLLDLQPGAHRLAIQAFNRNGEWSASTIWRFEIQPAWWQTNLAKIGLALLLILCGGGFTRWRLLNLRAAREHEQEIRRLEHQALQAQMNPHFIFNCLNSIQHFVARNEKQKANLFLARFGHLIRLALHASVDGEVRLHEEIEMLENYLRLEQMRFDHTFKFSIQVQDGLDTEVFQVPPMMIQPFVENAVLHGMRDNQGDGEIQVRFWENAGGLYVLVRDNGPGYRTEIQRATSEKHRSVGMTLTHRRLELLSQFGNQSHFDIRERRDVEGRVIGTDVEITFGLEHLKTCMICQPVAS